MAVRGGLGAVERGGAMSALALFERALKAASRELLAACGGSREASAIVGVRRQHLDDCANVNTDLFLRAHEIGALEDVTTTASQPPIVTTVLAKRQGYELVRLPEAAPCTGALIEQLLALATEHGQLSAALATALADGRCCAADAAKVLPEAEQMLSVGAAIRATLQAIVREQA